jgi:hypothetical protein
MEHRFQHYQSTLMARETAFLRPATFDIETCEPALMHQQLSARYEKRPAVPLNHSSIAPRLTCLNKRGSQHNPHLEQRGLVS